MEEAGKKISEWDKVYQQACKELHTGRGNLTEKVEAVKKWVPMRANKFQPICCGRSLKIHHYQTIQ